MGLHYAHLTLAERRTIVQRLFHDTIRTALLCPELHIRNNMRTGMFI